MPVRYECISNRARNTNEGGAHEEGVGQAAEERWLRRQGRGERERERNPGDASGRNRDAGTDVYSRHVNHKARSNRVRPVNSRVPCYFEYKNFRGIARSHARASGLGSERASERRAALKFYRGLPRQPSKPCNRVVYLHERAMPFRRLAVSRYE